MDTDITFLKTSLYRIHFLLSASLYISYLSLYPTKRYGLIRLLLGAHYISASSYHQTDYITSNHNRHCFHNDNFWLYERLFRYCLFSLYMVLVYWIEAWGLLWMQCVLRAYPPPVQTRLRKWANRANWGGLKGWGGRGKSVTTVTLVRWQCKMQSKKSKISSVIVWQEGSITVKLPCMVKVCAFLNGNHQVVRTILEMECGQRHWAHYAVIGDVQSKSD